MNRRVRYEVRVLGGRQRRAVPLREVDSRRLESTGVRRKARKRDAEWGGRRRGAGRKPTPDPDWRRYFVRISDVELTAIERAAESAPLGTWLDYARRASA